MSVIKRYLLAFLFSICGFACLIAYKAIGSYIDENGVLVEPFGFIPLFWLFQLLAVSAFAVSFIKSRRAG